MSIFFHPMAAYKIHSVLEKEAVAVKTLKTTVREQCGLDFLESLCFKTTVNLLVDDGMLTIVDDKYKLKWK